MDLRWTVIPTEEHSSILEVGGAVWRSKEAPKFLLKPRKAPRSCGRVCISTSSSQKLSPLADSWQLWDKCCYPHLPAWGCGSVHIVWSLQHLQDVAAALGTHKNLYSTAWNFCVLGYLDPGLSYYCPQPLSSSGREHPREITPALLSLFVPKVYSKCLSFPRIAGEQEVYKTPSRDAHRQFCFSGHSPYADPNPWICSAQDQFLRTQRGKKKYK